MEKIGSAQDGQTFPLGVGQGDGVEMREVTNGEAFVSESQTESQIGNLAAGKVNLRGGDAEPSAAQETEDRSCVGVASGEAGLQRRTPMYPKRWEEKRDRGARQRSLPG